MNLLNKTIELIFSPPFAILYLFMALIFSDGIFYYINTVDKLYVLGTILLCNLIPLLLVEKLFIKKKPIYYILSALFFIFSAYIISRFIFPLYVSIIYISFLWILTARVFFKKLDLRIAMYSAVIAFLYYSLYMGFVNSSISIMILFMVLGFLIGIKKGYNLLQVGYSFFVGVGCVYLAILFLII